MLVLFVVSRVFPLISLRMFVVFAIVTCNNMGSVMAYIDVVFVCIALYDFIYLLHGFA